MHAEWPDNIAYVQRTSVGDVDRAFGAAAHHDVDDAAGIETDHGLFGDESPGAEADFFKPTAHRA